MYVLFAAPKGAPYATRRVGRRALPALWPRKCVAARPHTQRVLRVRGVKVQYHRPSRPLLAEQPFKERNPHQPRPQLSGIVRFLTRTRRRRPLPHDRPRARVGPGIAALNERVQHDSRVENVFLTVRDGVMETRK